MILAQFVSPNAFRKMLLYAEFMKHYLEAYNVGQKTTEACLTTCCNNRDSIYSFKVFYIEFVFFEICNKKIKKHIIVAKSIATAKLFNSRAYILGIVFLLALLKVSLKIALQFPLNVLSMSNCYSSRNFFFHKD